MKNVSKQFITLLTKMNFFDKVYEVVKSVPKGKVITYGLIAEILGNKKMARQVGWALHANPNPESIPCYRVVSKEGRVSKAFVFGGENMQRALLENDGITFDEKGCVNSCFFVEKSL